MLVGEAGRIIGSVMVGHDAPGLGSTTSRQVPMCEAPASGGRSSSPAEWLRQRGVVKVQLLLWETNTEVVGFYERLDFELAPCVI